MFYDKENNLISYQQLCDKFSTINDIPFYLSEDEYKELAYKVSLYIKNEELALKSIQSSNIKTKTTRKRIELYRDSKLKMLKKIKSTLEGFIVTLDAQRLPKSSFNPYLELFFKDWLHDQKDNLSYLEKIPTGKNNILFLGCGAARLAYEYAKKNPKTSVYATDLNPINLCLLYNQKKSKLFDVVKNPISLENTANKFEFTSPERLDNFYPFISDFYSMQVDKFDHIVSNWFLDILPQDIYTNLGHIASLLKENGEFTYIGLSNFYNKTIEESYTHEEINEIFLDYFDKISSDIINFDYLNCEYVSAKRREQLLIINASELKQNKADSFKKENITLNFNQSLINKKMEFLTYAGFLKHVEGNISTSDAAKILIKEFGFTEDEAKSYANLMIEKLNS